MKTELTTEQSKYLCRLGFSKWRVKEIKPLDVSLKDWIPTITLDDLLKILPKEIYPTWLLRMDINKDKSCVYYKDGVSIKCTKVFSSKELIDSLYELTIWCIENGHLKFD